ncbi:MAG: hypothetical protein QM666_02335 [Acinetobacter sp.]
MKINVFLVLLTTVIFTGCVTTKPIRYATTNQQTITVSSEQISAMTESGAGDYFIKDSQITVGDARNATSSPVSGMFGLVGVGIATAIDKKSNSNAIEKSTLNRPITFDKFVKNQVNELMSQKSSSNSSHLLTNDPTADIKLVPFSRLSLREKSWMNVHFGMKSHFKNAADQNASTKRFYQYIGKNRATQSEWEANNNALFMQKADQAFTALSEAFVLDLQQKLKLNSFNPEKQAICQKTLESINIFYIDSPENLCIGVSKTTKGKVLETTLFVADI